MRHFKKISSAAKLRGSAGGTIRAVIVAVRAPKWKKWIFFLLRSQYTYESLNPGKFRFHLDQFTGKLNKGKCGPYSYPKIFRSPIHLGRLCFSILRCSVLSSRSTALPVRRIDSDKVYWGWDWSQLFRACIFLRCFRYTA